MTFFHFFFVGYRKIDSISDLYLLLQSSSKTKINEFIIFDIFYSFE